jgi:hypothetical protein
MQVHGQLFGGEPGVSVEQDQQLGISWTEQHRPSAGQQLRTQR